MGGWCWFLVSGLGWGCGLVGPIFFASHYTLKNTHTQTQLFTCGRGEYGRLGLGDQKSHLTMAAVEGLKVGVGVGGCVGR